MKPTLRSKIEGMRDRMSERITQLDKFIEEYKKEDNFDAAAKCQINVNLLKMIHAELQTTLNNY